jgi:hypothetical protein
VSNNYSAKKNNLFRKENASVKRGWEVRENAKHEREQEVLFNAVGSNTQKNMKGSRKFCFMRLPAIRR